VSAIDHYINAIIEQAEVEAKQDGSAVVEAHHLLLAIAAHEGTAAHRALASAGLDRQALRDALDREFEHSLSAAGVSLASYGVPQSSPDPKRRVSVGASVRLALERGFAYATRKKDLRPAHLLLGILGAEVGTVPRALAQTGADRTELIAHVRRTTANESW
jgi:ATP-dependent Clp protease ATP-binding subunit ClpA